MNEISNWGEAALTSVAAALALFLAAVPRTDPMTPGNDIPPAEPGSKRGPVF
jgi:hypothetical protein